jgi:hypothetical protein
MFHQGRKHLAQPHGRGATLGAYHQRALLQVGDLALPLHLWRQRGVERALQAAQACGVVLKAGEGVAAAQKAMEQPGHKGGCAKRHEAGGCAMINSRLCRIDVDPKT